MATKGFWGAGAVDTPPDLSVLTSVGYPTSGDPAKGIPATKPRAAWYFITDQARLSVIQAAGMSPKASDTQFLEALQSMKWVPAQGIEGAKLKNGSVSTLTLANGAVTAEKLAPTINLANKTLQLKALPTSERTRITPAKGELVVDTTTWSIYFGDGSTAGGKLAGADMKKDIEQITEVLTVHSNAIARLGGQNEPFSEV